MLELSTDEQARLRAIATKKRFDLAEYIFVYGDNNGRHSGNAAVLIGERNFPVTIAGIETMLNESVDSDDFRNRVKGSA